jgi:predicted porin
MRIRSKASAPFKVMTMLLVALGVAAPAFGDAASDQQLRDQVKVLMQQVEELKRQVGDLKKGQAQQPAPAATAQAPAAAAPAPAVAAAAPPEPKFEKFLKGFYGTLDVSFDDTTKGMKDMIAYHIQNGGTGPGLDYTNPKGPPVGLVNYMPALSTNKSQIGYRGSHKIGSSDFDFVYQVETSLALTSAPGLRTSSVQQSNVVTGAIGLGDTFLGVQNKDLGRLRFGTFYSPYKRSTDRMNPFSGMLGDYAVVMGNSGGDNRVEFGTRLEHSIEYDSPQIGGVFSVGVLASPGQNRTFDNVIQSAGSPDCSGGNMPGSGDLLLNCDDGGFGDAYSIALQFEYEGFYATAAYEIHKGVNRDSDGIGSNNPIYAQLLNNAGVSAGGVQPNGTVAAPTCNDPSGILDCGTFLAVASEFPNWASVGGGTPPYLPSADVADESAWKIGVQYKFPFGLTASAIWEHLDRNVPSYMTWQNERKRDGHWLALSEDLTEMDNVSVGWAHAGKTPGDPGGQHNYNPLAGANTADMYTAAWKHRFDKQLYWYVDWALTLNHGNAHYDLGAGGRGLTTDCHDGTNAIITDGGSFGPTTWGGCRVQGFSTGLDYRF